MRKVGIVGCGVIAKKLLIAKESGKLTLPKTVTETLLLLIGKILIVDPLFKDIFEAFDKLIVFPVLAESSDVLLPIGIISLTIALLLEFEVRPPA